MPPSGRKGKTRVRRAPAATETHDQPSDAETPDALATPSRGSRKRARGGEATAPASRNTRRKIKDTRPPEREDTEGTELQYHSDDETEPSLPTEQDIIASLKVADKHVNATEDYANELLEGQEEVPGYGKIAGRDWVFIIRKLEVNIGRPETQERLVDGDGASVRTSTPTAKTVVDIDLGPDRQVSRVHAMITYDGERAQWYLVVNGRNGLRVDNNLQKRGSKIYLRNGSVIEIANTQMAFITTAVDDNDGPLWDASIIKQAQKSSEEDEDGEDEARTHSNRNHVPAPGRSQLQDRGMYQSDYNNPTQQTHHNQQHRTHPHSQRSAVHPPPGTPMRTQTSYPKSSPAANYSRGVMMESTESIDYSADNARDLKPPHSYAQMIGMAILSTQEQQMTLNNIYKWIMSNYAFYRFNSGGWQNSIRHNLSLNKAFSKVARRTDEPGKGMKWIIEPTEYDNFIAQGMKGCRRPNPLPGTQSTLGSPTSPMGRLKTVKRDDETTPPLNSYQPAYSAAMDAYTPERGSRRAQTAQLDSSVGLGIENNSVVDYDFPQRATPRNGMTAVANAAGSPPALYVNDEGRTGPLDTPFPLRPSQRLAPPSTLRRPSDFIQFSSPAPFWKMEGLTGSTPFKPFDLSPLKTPFPSLKKGDAEEQRDEEEEDETSVVDEQDGAEQAKQTESDPKGSPVISSSSPPRPTSSVHALDASPTMSRPATAVGKTLSQLANAADMESGSTTTEKTPPATSGSSAPIVQQQQTPPNTVSQTSQPAARAHELPQAAVANKFDNVRPAVNGSYSSSSYTSANGSLHTNGYNPPPDDGEDEGIDLVKGFQPIGAFHQRNHLAMGAGMVGAPSYGR
ncbi:hypothetical protein M409DRAFT_69250 [Zasmidium cellare ATCC 36951]|uniref:Fork-head domain-containing protein n=1 Tax=Zasmidium cellare ATCC 36951 TaxID=1080233 RepID=A0A6A6C5J2_ZASCE|nr:uncharacterized protein M409DRAFT_69250 [Zasmidium cellare ATCC 36951]KAF2162374.1 hypothetical protein M409DRAFT_69250 [Zasmidium cellare ATCC 36951]